jgi:hypothetical protein
VGILDEVPRHVLGHLEVGVTRPWEPDGLDVAGRAASMRFASIPTACTSPVRWSIATTEGSESTIPRPRT